MLHMFLRQDCLVVELLLTHCVRMQHNNIIVYTLGTVRVHLIYTMVHNLHDMVLIFVLNRMRFVLLLVLVMVQPEEVVAAVVG